MWGKRVRRRLEEGSRGHSLSWSEFLNGRNGIKYKTEQNTPSLKSLEGLVFSLLFWVPRRSTRQYAHAFRIESASRAGGS